jgi:hypothetical protein
MEAIALNTRSATVKASLRSRSERHLLRAGQRPSQRKLREAAQGQQRTCSEASVSSYSRALATSPRSSLRTTAYIRNYPLVAHKQLEHDPGRIWAESITIIAGHGLVFIVLSFALAQGNTVVDEMVPGFFHFN